MASVVCCLSSPIEFFFYKFKCFLIFFQEIFFYNIYDCPTVDQQSVYGSIWFFLCIDCNLPDNVDILLSPRSLFVRLFRLVLFLVCLNSFPLLLTPLIPGCFVFRWEGRFWDVPSWKFCVLGKRWAAKWPSFPHLLHFIWLLSTTSMFRL